MPKEVPPSYNTKFIGGHDNLVKFETANGVEYDIRFKPSADYVAPQELWRDNLFEFVIDVAAAPDPTYIPNDPVVALTVIRIVAHFFADHERVILYICDDSDARERARKRKFDNWFSRFRNPLFEKYDLPTVAEGPDRYFASLLFRTDNPYRLAIITAFEQLAAGEK